MSIYQKLRIRIRAHRFLRKSESSECRFTIACLQEGMSAVDIGAHKAAYTYWMSRGVGKSGQVFAFEPVPVLVRYLNQYAASCRNKNIDVRAMALSDRSGTARLRIPGQDYMWSTLQCSQEGDVDSSDESTYVRVRSDTLDRQLESTGARRPIAFIKCDVEGHEFSVLRGAKHILGQDRPVLLLESAPLGPAASKDNPSMKLLDEFGYEGYFFFEDTLIPIAEHDANIHPSSTVGIQNFVFVHPESWTLCNPCAPYGITPNHKPWRERVA